MIFILRNSEAMFHPLLISNGSGLISTLYAFLKNNSDYIKLSRFLCFDHQLCFVHLKFFTSPATCKFSITLKVCVHSLRSCNSFEPSNGACLFNFISLSNLEMQAKN